MSRTLVASDNFNRASLGSDWAQINSDAGSMAINGSVEIYGPNALSVSDRQAVRWVGAGTFTDDQYSSLAITILSNLTTDYSIGVIARASADTNASRDCYQVCVCNDSAGPNYTTQFGKIVDGTYTSFNSAAIAWSINDRVEIECEGTTIRVCQNGTPLGGAWTVTDSALSTGAPGVNGAGSATFNGGDNWEGGSITAGGGGPSLMGRGIWVS